MDKEQILKIINEKFMFHKDGDIFPKHVPNHIKEKTDFQQKCNFILDELARVESNLEKIIFMTQEIGNFCGFYPLECLEKLKIMRVILEAEINGYKNLP